MINGIWSVQCCHFLWYLEECEQSGQYFRLNLKTSSCYTSISWIYPALVLFQSLFKDIRPSPFPRKTKTGTRRVEKSLKAITFVRSTNKGVSSKWKRLGMGTARKAKPFTIRITCRRQLFDENWRDRLTRSQLDQSDQRSWPIHANQVSIFCIKIQHFKMLLPMICFPLE